MEKDVIAEKPVVFILIGGYLPGKKYGGPVTSIENFVNHLCDKYEMRIICNDHDFNETEKYPGIQPGWNESGNAKAWFLNETDYSKENFIKIVKPFEERICMMYLSGIYYFQMNHAAIKAGKEMGIPVVMAPRGDLMRNSIMMKGFLSMVKKRGFLFVVRNSRIYDGVYIQATSREEAEGAKKYLHIPEDMIFDIPNLPMQGVPYKARNKQKNILRMMFMSRIMVKKNLLDAIKAVGEVGDDYRIIFDIYGPKEMPDYWEECASCIDEVSNENRIITYKGSLDTQAAKKIYSEYECFIFPTLSENYGHVIAEALLSNCPVLLSRGTTPWDSYEGHGVYLSDLHDLDGLAKNIEALAQLDSRQYESMVKDNHSYILEEMKIDEMKDKYISMIEAVSNGGKAR